MKPREVLRATRRRMSSGLVMSVWAAYMVGRIVGSVDADALRMAISTVISAAFIVALWSALRREKRMEALDRRAYAEMTEPRSIVGIPERVEVTQGEGPSVAYAQRAEIVAARLEVARERGSSDRFIAFLERSLEWLVEGERIALAREQQGEAA